MTYIGRQAAMSAPPPFVVTPKAERWLMHVGNVPDMQPGIHRTFRYDIHKDGELTEEFDGVHYSVGFDTAQSWVAVRSGIRVTIARREFWLPPDTVDSLRGKTLTLIQQDVGRGRHAGKIRDLLVAV